MAVSFASNVASLKAQAQLARTTSALNSTFERLSSGLRINSASDDPAGIQIADSLRAQSRIATVAIRNASDGISWLSIADSALGEVSTVLSRMAELATQSANGVNTMAQRSAMALEYLALGSEIARIAVTTEFNGSKLLSNSSSITIQVGLNGNSNSMVTLQNVRGTIEALGLGVDNSAPMTYSIISTTSTASQTAATLALDAVTSAMNTVTINRGILGASENRLTVAIDYLSVTRENLVAAEARIRDVDVAQEVAEMVRLQVLQQSQAAVLAQANQQPAIALSLLQ